MAEPKTLQISAPSLQGKLVGVLDEEADVALFRGIPYASVTKRWTHSVTQHCIAGGGVLDATKYGPRCCQADGLVLVSGGVNDPTPGDDEFKCLNLNVSVPGEALRGNATAAPLPVMVWIHGGAFHYGANSVARYRPVALLKHARDCGAPFILVQMNYRLGAFGCAASSDLAAELGQGTREQPLGNFALVDQRNALEWVNRHIQDFGGDPSRITVFGVSAGSASVHMHLLAGETHQLFDRAIMMSGAAPVLCPLPAEFYQAEWDSLCGKSGVTASDPAHRLEQLRALSPDTIIKNSTKAALAPVGDGKLLPTTWRFADEVPRHRCKDIILGDTNVEAVIFDGLLSRLSQERFHAIAQAKLSPELRAEVYKGFGFTTEPQPADAFRNAFRLLVGNVLFNYPNLGIAEASGKSKDWADHVFIYHFEEPSPFQGPTHGLSYHGLCALMLHLNELDQCPEPTKKVSRYAAQVWAKFAYGEQPWEPYSQQKRFMRFGPDGESGLHDFNTDTTRVSVFHDLLEGHLPEVIEFVRALMEGTET